LVAARRPARHLVYLCAVVLEVGLSLMDQGPDQMAAEFANGWVDGLSKPDEQGRMAWVDFDFVRKVFYPDCDEPTVAAAIDHLRPQAAYPWMQPCSLSESPSVPCTYVICTEDQVLSNQWSRRIARRIGADIVELPGGHSPLLSRPSAVADVLLRVADEPRL
jgi:pimeloyl-ACP methyl ester carboxylesterase